MRESYDDLDHLADQERAAFMRKGETPWHLGWFYDALQRGGERRDSAPLFDFSDRLQKWMTTRPESLTAQVANVRYLVERAWDERGGDVAPSVTEEGWAGFYKFLNQAKDAAEAAQEINQIDPELNVLRMRIARHLENDDGVALVFDEAVGLTPPYYRLYEHRARFLFPKWGGAQDGSDIRTFQQKALALTRSEQKTTMNLLFAKWLIDAELVKAAHIVGITWEQIETAYLDAVSEATDEEKSFFLNLVCWLACNYEKRDRAEVYFTKMDGEHWSHIWARSRVNMWHAWVQGEAPKPKLNDIHRAVWDGIPSRLRRALAEATPGAIDARDEHGRTPLYVAVFRDWPTAVSILLDAGANPDIPIPSGEVPLVRATIIGNSSIAKALLSAGADPSVPKQSGASAIHFAVQSGNADLVHDILDKDPTLIEAVGDERTPLHLAVTTGQLVVTRLLIERGANIDARGWRNATPLIAAAYTNQMDTARILLNHEPDLDLFDDKGWTPLHAAIDSDLTDFARMLVEAGANPNHPGKGQSTPMHVAIRSHQHQSLDYLVGLKGVRINAQDKRGQSLLHTAAAAGAVDEAKVLLEHGIDKSLKDSKDRTALDIATRYKRKEIVALLE